VIDDNEYGDVLIAKLPASGEEPPFVITHEGAFALKSSVKADVPVVVITAPVAVKFAELPTAIDADAGVIVIAGG